MEFVGKNKDFTAKWDCSTQSYTVFKNGKVLVENSYKFSDIKTYLN
jgi:hypothetical protein